MSKLEKAIGNLSEIIKLAEPELSKNDKNVSAILDLKDLKSLSLVLEELNNSIPKQKVRDLKYNLEKEYISLGKKKTEQSACVMLGIEFATDKISELLEGK